MQLHGRRGRAGRAAATLHPQANPSPSPSPNSDPNPNPNPEQVELPPPCILKPVELWTGKQVFSVLLRPNGVSPLRVNGEGPNKRYNVTRTAPPPLHMCADDGYICFQDSELV